MAGMPPDQGKGYGEKEMRKKKIGGNPSVCSDCHQLIDVAEVVFALRANLEYRHPCGKILARAK
jgi:hypothetical protein